MELRDYYSPMKIATKIGHRFGRGARIVRNITVQTAETVGPLKASAVVGGIWGGMTGLINLRRYRQGKITRREAASKTARETAGMGIATGIGLVASNAVRTSLLVASTSVLPLAMGVVMTSLTKIFWDSLMVKRTKAPGTSLSESTRPETDIGGGGNRQED